MTSGLSLIVQSVGGRLRGRVKRTPNLKMKLIDVQKFVTSQQVLAKADQSLLKGTRRILRLGIVFDLLFQPLGYMIELVDLWRSLVGEPPREDDLFFNGRCVRALEVCVRLPLQIGTGTFESHGPAEAVEALLASTVHNKRDFFTRHDMCIHLGCQLLIVSDKLSEQANATGVDSTSYTITPVSYTHLRAHET